MPRLEKGLWDTLEPLLDQALDLSPDARAEWLAKLRVESPTIATELERFLAAEAALTVDVLGSNIASPLLEPNTSADRRVGQYTLDRPVGYGGMGTVWLGHRSDGRYEGQVAIKLLSLALLGRAGEQRFAQEGTALARLTHPNIARLLDAGVTQSGQPYLVLEFVEGEPIDQFAKGRRLSLERRIELFLEVLAAVSSAHANLIVHRDIKPSNILVTAEGLVKLLDFGIAKLLSEGRSTTEPTATDPSARALTPEYAAPEQILGEPVSTATDVYSLGVLLYILLTGVHPTGARCLTATDHLRATLAIHPLRLSEAPSLTLSPEDRSRIATERASSPERLRRRCRGDLDAILAKALEKDPATRYQTVAALADDLARWLNHEPVAARPDSWSYRASKFLRRNRGAVLAAGVATLSVVVGSGLAVREMLVADRQRDEAVRGLRRMTVSQNFESTLFRLIGPSSPAMTYRQLLEKGQQALETEYRRDPLGAVELASNFAVNYRAQEDYPAASEILRRALRIADSIGDPGREAHIRCSLAGIFALTQRIDSARILIAAARRLIDRADRFDEEPRRECDNAAGDVFTQMAWGDSAGFYFQRVLDREIALRDTASQEYTNVLNDLAYAYAIAGRSRKAEQLTARLVAMTRSGASADPAAYPIFTFNASAHLIRLGEIRGALDLVRREMTARGERDSTLLESGLIAYQLAMLYSELEFPDSAAIYFRRAIGRPDRVSSEFLFIAFDRLAAIAAARGATAEAGEYRAHADQIYPRVKASGEAQQTVAIAGIEAAKDKRTDQLFEAVRAALKSLHYSPTDRRETLIPTLRSVSEVLLAAGAYDSAAWYASELVRITAVDSLTYSRSARVGTGLLLEARAERGRGNRVKAHELAVRATAPLRFGLGLDHSLTRAAQSWADSLAAPRL